MTRLTVDDARQAGFCCLGQLRWARRVGIDMQRFVRHGMDTSDLEHIDDAKLRKAIARAEARERSHGS